MIKQIYPKGWPITVGQPLKEYQMKNETPMSHDHSRIFFVQSERTVNHIPWAVQLLCQLDCRQLLQNLEHSTDLQNSSVGEKEIKYIYNVNQLQTDLVWFFMWM